MKSPGNIRKRSFFFGTVFCVFLSCVIAHSACAAESWNKIRETGRLRWGADTVGGAPYVYTDPKNPGKIIGFEVDIMDAVARELGVRPELVVVQWDQLVPALCRGDFDAVFNGLEITQERLGKVNFTAPYYLFSEQITVRKGDRRIRGYKDLRGRKVGTLSATLSQSMMEKDGGIKVVTYPSPVEAYKDLEIGRVDAVMQDLPIAAYYVPRYPALENVGEPVGEGLYGGASRKDSPVLSAKLNAAVTKLLRNGECEKIYRKWGIWTKKQQKIVQRPISDVFSFRRSGALVQYIPLLLKGACMTIAISCLAMVLASALGFLICLGKLYGQRPLRWICTAAVEIIRGTPLLIQLYILYYGLPNLGIQLNAFAAAVLGMGINYAAYESEIYRAGLLSIPKGQEEAARSLGMTGAQSMRYVIVPQALRTILPPSTNDFIALFKDTSLVSIITVTELTRTYSQAATSTYRFLELGLMTAVLYLLMSLPLSLWSRRMEERWNVLMH